MRTSVVTAALACLAAGPAPALDLSRLLGPYATDAWRIQDGLPHDRVQQVVQTADGYIWLGTPAGLVRFDGVEFVRFRAERLPDLDTQPVTALCPARAGGLWVGTEGMGLVRIQAAHAEQYTQAQGLSGNTVWAIAEDRRGAVWIATSGGGLNILRDGKVTSLPAKDNLRLGYIRSLFEDAKGRIWAGAHRGAVYVFDGERVATRQCARSSQIWAIAEDREGTVWVGTATEGLKFFRRGALQAQHHPGLRDRSIRALKIDRNGNVWAGMENHGIALLRNGNEIVFGAKVGFPEQTVLSFAEDHEGGVWVGTRARGLVRFKETRFMSYTARQGLPEADLSCLWRDRAGSLWVGTRGGGLVRLDEDGGIQRYGEAEGLPAAYVWSLHEGRDGTMWVGGEGAGLLRIGPDRRLARHWPASGHEPVFARCILEDRTGRLWLGTNGRGIISLKGGKVVRYLSDGATQLSFVWCSEEAPDGALWFGTRGGLVRFHGGGYETITAKQGLPNEHIAALHASPDGTMWAGTNGGGLVRLRGGKLASYGTKEGLASNRVFQILEDGKRNLWLGYEAGIFSLAIRDLDELDAGRLKTVACRSFGADDGLSSTEALAGHQPGSARDANGRLWFGTIRAVASIDPADVRSNAERPPVHIDRAYLDGAPLDLSGAAEAGPGHGDLEIHYTALSFQAPHRVGFRHRLENFDRGWVGAGSRRLATYRKLPPGTYRFTVTASNNDGVWNDSGATLTFRLRPHFYQTWWFYGFSAAGFAAAAYSAHRLRVAQVRGRFAAVLNERNRLSRELHDTLAQGFTGVSVQLEVVAKMLSSRPEQAARHLDQARLLVRTSLAEVRRAIWGLRPEALDETDLAGALRELGRETEARAGVRCDVSVGAPLPRLSNPQEINLLRIAQEALNNALIHGRPNRVWIELSPEGGNVRLTVRDDGGGFLPDTGGAGGCLGLRSMRERAEQMGGGFTVVSSPGKGTETTVVLPQSGTAARFKEPEHG